LPVFAVLKKVKLAHNNFGGDGVSKYKNSLKMKKKDKWQRLKYEIAQEFGLPGQRDRLSPEQAQQGAFKETAPKTAR
jgi:hypothetical protein